MAIEEVREELGVRAEDVQEIKRMAGHERRIRLAMGLGGAIVAVLAFMLGYVVGAKSETGYPYSASSGPALGLALRVKPRFGYPAIAVVGVLMFLTGLFVQEPAMGVTTYHGTYSR